MFELRRRQVVLEELDGLPYMPKVLPNKLGDSKLKKVMTMVLSSSSNGHVLSFVF